MTNSVITTSSNAPFKYILRIMQDHRVSGIPVTDDAGRLVGIVSEADLLKAESAEPSRRNVFIDWFLSPRRLAELERRAEDVRAEDVMTRDVVTVSPETPVPDAARTLLDLGAEVGGLDPRRVEGFEEVGRLRARARIPFVVGQHDHAEIRPLADPLDDRAQDDLDHGRSLTQAGARQQPLQDQQREGRRASVRQQDDACRRIGRDDEVQRPQ